MDLKQHLAPLGLALIALLSGCDEEEAQAAEGSCQALVSETLAVDYCNNPLGLNGFPDEGPDAVAGCAVELFDIEPPEEDSIKGLAYQVAYRALCDLHGDEMPQYCEISSSLGCEG